MPREHIHHIHRVVLFTLDSLYSGVALHELLETFPERVVLVVASQRYGKKYGSFLKQFKKNLRRSGWRFTTYLSLHLVFFYPILMISDILNFLLKRKKRVYSIRQLAKKHNIPLITTNEPNEKVVVDFIASFNPDLIVSAYFDHVIRKSLMQIPKFGIINVHTALLPDYKGPFPSLWPLIHGEKKIGVTIHYVNSEDLDAGPILMQKECPLDGRESVLEVDCRLFRQGISLVKEAIVQIEEGTAHSIGQEPHGRYFSFPRPEDVKKLYKQGGHLYSIKGFLKQFF